MTTVMITGAARGLGFEFTKLYAARGWKVLACARKPDRLKSVKGDVQHHPLEVTDYEAVTALAQKLDGEAIDILICNAASPAAARPGRSSAPSMRQRGAASSRSIRWRR
jgi:NAD(P)-dependent dehydrogenase (short-subunit alcohol dehydrogenase family)